MTQTLLISPVGVFLCLAMSTAPDFSRAADGLETSIPKASESTDGIFQLECHTSHYRGVFQADRKDLIVDATTGTWHLTGGARFVLFAKSGRKMLERKIVSRGPGSEYFAMTSNQELQTIELETDQGLLVMGGEPARLQFFAGSIHVREKATCTGSVISDSLWPQAPAND